MKVLKLIALSNKKNINRIVDYLIQAGLLPNLDHNTNQNTAEIIPTKKINDN